jgi:hypothetical protein
VLSVTVVLGCRGYTFAAESGNEFRGADVACEESPYNSVHVEDKIERPLRRPIAIPPSRPAPNGAVRIFGPYGIETVSRRHRTTNFYCVLSAISCTDLTPPISCVSVNGLSVADTAARLRRHQLTARSPCFRSLSKCTRVLESIPSFWRVICSRLMPSKFCKLMLVTDQEYFRLEQDVRRKRDLFPELGIQLTRRKDLWIGGQAG